MSSIKEIIHATLASKTFHPFYSGVEFRVSKDHEPITLKVVASQKIERSSYYRRNSSSYETIVEGSNGIRVHGFGESNVPLISLQKSISEAVERFVFKTVQSHYPEFKNSNGWAAHLTQAKARVSAQNELLERDTALLHWLSHTPLKHISAHSLPKNLKLWVEKELSKAPRFNQLKILISQLGVVPIIATLIHDQDNFGFVSQGFATDLESAVEKALSETCRIADLFEKGKFSTSFDVPNAPDDFAIYYAIKEPFPLSMIGKSIQWKDANKFMKRKSTLTQNFKFRDYNCGNLHISFCESSDVQNLYFEPTQMALKNGLVNKERIKKLTGTEDIFLMPHFVP